ncbi:tripartite motif containing 101 [Cololabis saira]|uniref:tripartite motif containing 101 n=1 Tax=Cololabis saira TaxID=129043 RepID=UPI002AD3AFB6|nr:tripartite motif containing 101 [Cololabis saira]XP_061591726.1 tripartite motif containing 101 [Cololabis saira]XP_061591727.1 tripartite motif containing 101 [Cololabis saira]XP_061591728.1 tripartite motif containing 101 [Cololabis saira]XP_061591729.1 tripartite motif containing 101 [Cololabis saira]XP_061591730.1 tripartite motif containing 101 [Cololabis saira]XP_061591731.1 tripartite motif containing 101 [Cololabis saira]XP_061591732.1 tripartite motif containing 101 [Cololabis sa
MSLSADRSPLGGIKGAESEATLVTLEKQLMCPICLEMFRKPVVILPCQHNLCRKCANELYQPSLFQARTTMSVNSGRFRCPSCRQEVVLDRHGVYGLPRNILVENIIDSYKQEISIPSPLPTPPPPSQLTCSSHEDEKVNIYCLTCQVPTCSLCKVFGAHQSCQVAPLTDVHQQQKDELSKGITSLMAFTDKVKTLINELEDTCRTIEENSKIQKQRVCDKFNQVLSILENRRKVMEQKISPELEEKAGYSQLLVRCYEERIEANRKLVQSTQSSMDELDMAAFVQNSRQLTTKVIAAASACPSEMLKLGCENPHHNKLNFSKQERALKSISFMKVSEDVPEAQLDPEQENSVPNLDGVVGSIKEPVPALLSPPLEPAGKEMASDPPATTLQRPSLESVGECMQLEQNEFDANEEGQGHFNVESRKEMDEVQKALESPHPANEHQEGMSTQQAVTLIFYLLGFIAILQKLWDYIGCFI